MNDPRPIFEAARRDREDIVKMLLDLGVSPNVSDADGQTGLHAAAYAGALKTATVLIDRGAEVDPLHRQWGSTPIGGANWGGHRTMVDYLAKFSNDIWELTFIGKVGRMRELLAIDSNGARVMTANRHTLLMWLPQISESLAFEMAELLMANGADPSVVNAEGKTAADLADRLAMFNLASWLRAATNPSHPSWNHTIPR